MKRILSLLVTITFFGSAFSQNGTPGNPFTTLAQASGVVTSGQYFFNIDGNVFDTYVETGGWVLIASSSGSGTSAALTITSSLTMGGDQILPAAVYQNNSANMNVTSLRFSAATGPNAPFDVRTNNSTVDGATIISNLRNNETLSDNVTTFDHSYWTANLGDPSHMEVWGTPTTGTLDTRIWHSTGNGNGFHWRPLFGEERIAFGQVGNNPLNLWVSAFSVLPVQLTSFSALVQNDKVKLDWSTATESNNNYFTIEKSTDNQHWTLLAKVNGAGNSTTPKNYTVYDNSPAKGVQFYRLSQTNFDGKTQQNGIRKVSFGSNTRYTVFVYPNPVSDKINLQVDGPVITNATVKVIDAAGRVQYTARLTSPSQTIDTRGLQSGVYFVLVNVDGEVQQLKVVKY